MRIFGVESTDLKTNVIHLLAQFILLYPISDKLYIYICIYIYQLVSKNGPGRGMRCNEAPLLKVCELQGCQPTIPDVPSLWQMKFVRRNGGKKKNLTYNAFVYLNFSAVNIK